MRAIDKMRYTEQYEPKHTYTFVGKCIVTGKNYSVTVAAQELFNYNQTGKITEFVSLSVDDREFLLSGTSPEGWDILFKKEEE